MINLPLQSDIDKRTEMAIDWLIEMHSMGVLVCVHAEDGDIHVDQLKEVGKELGYDFVQGEAYYGEVGQVYYGFTKMYRDDKPWLPSMNPNEKLPVWR